MKKQVEILKANINEITEKPKREESLKLEFSCPICGSSKYDGVYGDSSFVPLCGRMYPKAYSCKGCSVIFHDPEKFTKAKKPDST